MSRQVKEMIIAEIESQLADVRELLIIDSSRVDAVTDNAFRISLEKSGISALTVKNSLARKALGNLGVSGADPLLEGPSTLVWGSEDVVQLSKEMTKWAKQIDALEICGATIEGQTLDAEAVKKLSKSPGRLELIGQIAGLLLGPGALLAGAIQGPGGKLAGAIQAIADKEDSDVLEE